MGLYTGTVKGLHRAPYRTQVIVHLLNKGLSVERFEQLTPAEQAKVDRVQRFLPAGQCADEIAAERERADRAARRAALASGAAP